MPSSWYRDNQLWLELFVLVNISFLGPDIYLAHSTNGFRHWAEYIPLAFSLGSPVLLFVTLIGWRLRGTVRPWRWSGHLVGWLSVLVGMSGLVWHLDSRFFSEMTLDSLVYTAPFAAPLAFTGIGLLLIMNRMVEPSSEEWARWVLVMALGGFVGNFVFGLADHAQNGFFHATEWIPVVSAALAIGFLVAPFLVSVTRSFLVVAALAMAVQVPVGLLGFYYHTVANLHGPSRNMYENFIHGAPAMAPLLFPNLVLLAMIGLWTLAAHVPGAQTAEPG